MASDSENARTYYHYACDSLGSVDYVLAGNEYEYDDIFAINGFRARQDGRSFQAKEFGNIFEETLEFANKSINSDKVAIIKVTISEEIYNKLNHMNLDMAIFKSGTPVDEPEMLDIFNKNIINIEHVFWKRSECRCNQNQM